MCNPVYCGNSWWTANKNWGKNEALVNSAKGAKKMTSYFSVSELVKREVIRGLLK
jgi:hypothetical protein